MSPEQKTWQIRFSNPSNQRELFEHLAAVVSFANKLGLAGQAVGAVDFSHSPITDELIITARAVDEPPSVN